VIEKVTIEGYRLPSPANCPEEIYQWILDCWNNEAEQRPSFQQLYDRIEKKWEQAIQNQPEERIPNANQANNNNSSVILYSNEQ